MEYRKSTTALMSMGVIAFAVICSVVTKTWPRPAEVAPVVILKVMEVEVVSTPEQAPQAQAD